jgi:hypothetical protein
MHEAAGGDAMVCVVIEVGGLGDEAGGAVDFRQEDEGSLREKGASDGLGCGAWDGQGACRGDGRLSVEERGEQEGGEEGFHLRFFVMGFNAFFTRLGFYLSLKMM